MAETERFSLRDVLHVLFKHGRAIVLILLLAVATVGAYLAITPKQYSAATRVLVSIGREKFQQLGMETRPVGNLVFQERAQNVNNEVEILRDPALLAQAYPAMKERMLRDGPEVAAPAQPGFRGWLKEIKQSAKVWVRDAQRRVTDWLVDAGLQSPVDPDTALMVRFYRALTLNPVKETDVIITAFTWEDPVFAADALNIFLEEFKRKHLRVFEAKESVGFFEEQLRSAEATSEAVEAEYAAFLREGGLSNFELEKSQLLSQLNALRTDADGVRLEEENARMKLAAVLRAYRSNSGWIETLDANDAVAGTQALDQSFVQLLDQRTRLLARFQPGAEQVRDIDAQISRLRGQKFQSLSDFYRGRLAAAGDKLTRIERSIATKDESLRSLTERTIGFDDIQRRRTSATSLVAEYRRKLEELKVNSDLNSQSFSSVRVISEATPPVVPSAPKPALMLGLAAGFGFLGGLAYAVLAEFLSRTFSRPRQVSQVLRLPVLARVPELS